MNNSFLRSPSKLFATSILLALSLGITAAFSSSGEGQSKNNPKISAASVFPSPTVRRSQNIEISPKRPFPNTERTSPQIFPSSHSISESEIKQFHPISLKDGRGSGREKLTISSCNGQPGNANFRAGNEVIGIISSGTVVELTGEESGEWVEAIAAYWPTNRAIRETGKFWINRCWL